MEDYSKRDNILTKLLKRLGIIVEVKVNKEDMCKQAQSMCNHNCNNCIWGGKKDNE